MTKVLLKSMRKTSPAYWSLQNSISKETNCKSCNGDFYLISIFLLRHTYIFLYFRGFVCQFFFVLLVFVGTVLDSRETLELLLGSVRRLKTDPRPTDRSIYLWTQRMSMFPYFSFFSNLHILFTFAFHVPFRPAPTSHFYMGSFTRRCVKHQSNCQPTTFNSTVLLKYSEIPLKHRKS